MKKLGARQRISQLRQLSQRTLKDKGSKLTASATTSYSSLAIESIKHSAKSSAVTPTKFLKRSLNLQIPMTTSASPLRVQEVTPRAVQNIKLQISPTHRRLTPKPKNFNTISLLKAKVKDLEIVSLDTQRLTQELAVITALNLKLMRENELLKEKSSRVNSPGGQTIGSKLQRAMMDFKSLLGRFVRKSDSESRGEIG